MPETNQELVEKLRRGAAVAFSDDIGLMVKQEDCTAILDLLEKGPLADLAMLESAERLLAEALWHITDHGTIETGTEQSRKIINARATLRTIIAKVGGTVTP